MNKIFEYMALGKLIVQFELTEGKCSAQKASLYARKNDAIDFAKKILYLVDHSGERDRMGKFGRERVENTLKWDNAESKLLAAYDALFA